MDSFYAVVPLRRKTRVHFHAFMRDVHEELKTLTRRGRSARDGRAAHRAPLPAHLLRRVPRVGHRRRDDPRAPADRAVRRGRRVRHDVELSARRALSRRAEARELPAHDQAPPPVARRDRGRRRRRLSPAHARARGDVPRARPAPRPTPRWQRTVRSDAHRARRVAAAHDRGPPARRAGGARAARSGSTSRRSATARARSATTSSSRSASPCCSCPASR